MTSGNLIHEVDNLMHEVGRPVQGRGFHLVALGCQRGEYESITRKSELFGARLEYVSATTL
jgi:hypothetical protein